MKRIFAIALVILFFALLGLSFADSPSATPATGKIKVLIVTGGHGFKHDPFFKLFKDNPDITYTEAAEPNDFKKTDGAATDRPDFSSFDVVLLYNFRNNITDEQKKNFLSLFDKGVGLIVLHHALLSYQDWPEFYRIAGGNYLLSPHKIGEQTFPESTYQGDVDMDVLVADKTSPLTSGISDFHMKDELYRGVPTTSDIHPLLMTEGVPIAWSRTEKQSRVVSIVIGHGAGSYDNLNFQKLLANAIHWTAKRD